MAVIFHNIWNVILPIDFNIFQRGRYTTNQLVFFLANLPTMCCLQEVGLVVAAVVESWIVLALAPFWQKPTGQSC